MSRRGRQPEQVPGNEVQAGDWFDRLGRTRVKSTEETAEKFIAARISKTHVELLEPTATYTVWRVTA